MDPMTLVIVLGVLAGVLVLFYLSEREKNSVRRKRKRRFRPQWTRDSAKKRDRRRRSKSGF
jgi:hypothetical protein